MRSARWVSVIFIAGLVLVQPDSPSAKPPKRPVEGPLITIHAPNPEQFELALDEIVLDWSGRPGATKLAPAQAAVAIAGTNVVKREAIHALVAMTKAATSGELLMVATALKAANPGAEANLVLYLPGAAKDGASRQLLTSRVGLILEQGADPGHVVAGLPVVAIGPASVSGGYVIEAKDPLAALSLADALRQRPGVKHAYPLVRRPRFSR
jgi:hypothetical protein